MVNRHLPPLRKALRDSKKEAQRTARGLRKQFPNLTVNVKRITRRSWGVRFSPKGKRDKFDYKETRMYN